VNAQISKLFVLIVLLFGALVFMTSRWSVFEANALKEKTANKRPLLEQEQIPRGTIYADDGSVIAKSVQVGKGADRIYARHYPQGSLFGHPIGYSFFNLGQTEFERYHNDQLVGNKSEFSSILDQLQGTTQKGNDVHTSIDPAAQRLALDDIAAQGNGAVVAIVPQTGAVKVLASVPPYNPNEVKFPSRFKELNKAAVAGQTGPLFDTATQGAFPPGSTFKVVTAAAGLDSGKITPSTTINAPGTLAAPGPDIQNDFTQDFGPISLDTALTNSVNTWFAQLGIKIGQHTLFDYMNRFGFNTTPPIDIPSDELTKSGVYDNGNLLGPNDPVDLARLAFGQERLLVTPLQNAEVAAAIANGGKEMKPQIWSRVVDPDGRTIKTMQPSEFGQPISSQTASELNTAMQGVVSQGTGTNAAIPGITVAGKTGTAETPGACGGDPTSNQAWFIGFAPADTPKIAIAATIDCTAQFGNDVAAPIFKDVAELLLKEGG
jgi:peptidoglycan glycosyltransferase